MIRRLDAVPRRPSPVSRGTRMLLGLLAVAGLAGAVLGVGAASASHRATPTFAQACGTQPVTMEGYFETGFPDIIDLTQLFTKQYPNVKWHIRQDQFAVITQNAPLTLSGRTRPTSCGFRRSAPDPRRPPREPQRLLQAVPLEQLPGPQLASLRAAPTGRPRGSVPCGRWASATASPASFTTRLSQPRSG
jgi:raffinose/stachyose/melibiose transport system substrate-binding protein